MTARTLRVLSCALGLAGWVALIQPAPCAAQDDDALDLDDSEQASESDSEPNEAPSSAAEEGAVAEAPSTEPVPEPAAEDVGTAVVARVAFGGGLGMRSLRRPVMGGVQRLGTSYFPAADLALSVRVGPDNPFTVDVQLRYETSLGLTIEEPTLFALPNAQDVRSEHAEFSVAPGFRLGDSPTSPRVSIPIGGVFRNFWPADHHLQTPRYTLFGGMARIQLEANLGSVVRVRAGPEVQVFGALGTDLTDNGVKLPGFAFGGEASLEFRLSTTFVLEVQYRQANAVASAAVGPSFLDIERFATLRLAGEM
jgi:hypothetical protein